MPLFVGLGIARLLVVALPAALVGSPLFLIHAFYQLLLGGRRGVRRGASGVTAPARRRGVARSSAWRSASCSCTCSVRPTRVPSTSAFAAAHRSTIRKARSRFFPPFQVGLFLALSVAAFAILELAAVRDRASRCSALSQIAVFAACISSRATRPRAARARRPRLGAAGPLLLIACDGDACAAASLRRRGVSALALLLTLVIAAPVLRAPSDRIFGTDIVGRHHDPFTVMQQFGRPIAPRRLLAAVTDLTGARSRASPGRSPRTTGSSF